MGIFGGPAKGQGYSDPQPSAGQQESSVNDIPDLPEPRTDTVIAKDVTFSGNLHGEGVVQIEGTVEGEINLKGYVIVTSTGTIKGPITADVVRIAGAVEGNITALDHLQLERTGTIEGDVATVSFVIENGGRLNGRSTMIQPKQSTPRVDKLPKKKEKAESAEEAPV